MFNLNSPKIKLTDSVSPSAPRTFEEWCAIHGEPEYLYETKKTSEMQIDVIDAEEPLPNIDLDGIIYEDKQGRMRLKYNQFVDAFVALNKCVYCYGVFYTPNGSIAKQAVRRDIANSLADAGWQDKTDIPTTSIYNTLKDRYSIEELPVNDKVIPLANGDLHLNADRWEFRLGEFKQAPYRLSVSYTPVEKPMPLFNKWLNDVFVPEDIPVVQEIMGYCLVPVTAAQEAFFLVGDAGVGKSGLGTILRGLLGNAYVSMETQSLVTEKFQVATVENKLLAYDDDLGSAALTETGLLKKLITADTPIKGERKYADPHEFMSYCRILASANFMLSSLYDDSDGFYRRLHPILVKPRDPHRKTINRFYEMILEQEKPQILRWALAGLKRVIENGWKISWSDRSREYLSSVKSNTIHYHEFLEDTCDFGSGDVSTAELKSLYRKWCKENGIKETSDRRLEKWLAENTEKLGIKQDKHVRRNNKHVRGYINLCMKSEWNITSIRI